MRTISTTGVQAPPPHPETLRRSRILARVGVSPALAGAVADLAFGFRQRDDGALLVDLTAYRTAAAGAVTR